MADLAPSGIVTITTDFGLKDGNVAAMKGVIWTIAPQARIADISHLIPPQQIEAGCRIIARRIGYFPAGSVHIAVVDPGVGTERRPIAARFGQQFFVGPDNGLCTLLLADAGDDWQAVELQERRFWLPKISNVFHGRDIFAPVAAHLSAGVPLGDLGTPLANPVVLKWALPEWREDGSIEARIVEIDHFGNLALNLSLSDVREFGTQLEVVIGVHIIDGLYTTFGSRSPGELLAFIDSSDGLSVAVVNGSAAERLQARVGQSVIVRRVS